MSKLIPTDETGKEVTLDEETKLLNMTKKELVDIIQTRNTTHKRQLSKSKNLKQELEDANEKIEQLTKEVNLLKQQQEDTHTEAAQMSETIRIKNAIINEVVDTFLSTMNTIQSTTRQAYKILEYNRLTKNGGQ